MLNTLCNNCIFLNKQQSCCQANQLCLFDGGKIYIPGYCRLFRTKKWTQRLNLVNNNLLLQIATKECDFFYDLIILFKPHNILNQLQKTINSAKDDNYLRNIIVVCNKISDKSIIDTLMRFAKRTKKCYIIFTTESIPDHLLLYRAKNKIKSRYFVCLYADNVLSCYPTERNISLIRKQIFAHNNGINDLVMIWLFRQRIKNSLLISAKNMAGIYITDVYNKLCSQNLRIKEEILKLQQNSMIMLADTINSVYIT